MRLNIYENDPNVSDLVFYFATFGGVGVFYLFKNIQGNRFFLSELISVVLISNQFLFIGAYTGLRIPIILGLINKTTYLTKMPNTVFLACEFVNKTFKPNERYLSFLEFRSFYCPQYSAIYDRFDDERKFRKLTYSSLPK